MLEKLSKRLVPYGRAHAWLRWPILGLLMLAWGLDSAERLLDAGIAAAKKLPKLWTRVWQKLIPVVYTTGREARRASRQWFAAGRIAAGKLRRMTDGVRAELPALKRHAPQRAIAAALALVLCLGMLPVSAFAAETGCNHVHGETCYRQELTCGKEESEGHTHGDTCYTETQTCTQEEHTHGDTCMTDGVLTCTQVEHTHGPDCVESALTCDKAESEAHAHSEDCYTEVLDCQHVHDEACGGLTPAEPECDCGAVPDADGSTVHAEGCPLYTAPVLTCATCGEGHETAACPVEAVRALIAALPTAEEVAAMTEEEREASGVYDKLDAAYNAYDALSAAQKALLPDAMDVFTALQSALGAVPVTLESATELSIASAADLAALATAVNTNATTLTLNGTEYTIALGGEGTTFKLTGDIDLASKAWTPIGTYLLGSDYRLFKGVFDGQNHTIRNLMINNTDGDYQGLFGYISTAGSAVRNLTVIGSVTGRNHVGGIVGQARNGATIENCTSEVTVKGTGTSGGIGGVLGTGATSLTIRNCIATGGAAGTITGTKSGTNASDVGGVVGSVVAGSNDTGKPSTTIEGCFSSAAVTGVGDRVGGVLGFGCGVIIRNCYATGAVSGQKNIGGIVGGLLATNATDGNGCYSSYATGALTGPDEGTTYIGGIAGGVSSETVIKNCVALNLSISGKYTTYGRVMSSTSTSYITNNYARADMTAGNVLILAGNERHGTDITITADHDWKTWLGTNTSSVSSWKLPAAGPLASAGLPTLHGETPPMPEVKYV